MSEESELELALETQIIQTQTKPPTIHPRLFPDRKIETDMAWLDEKIALEVDGGIWHGGRHTRGQGYTEDRWKDNTLTLQGWMVLRVTGGQIESGEAINWITQALIMRKRP